LTQTDFQNKIKPLIIHRISWSIILPEQPYHALYGSHPLQQGHIVPFIIDGHNLIPKIAGIDLSDADDEMQLVEMLQDFCRITRKKVEVYFDNAPPGQPRKRQFGNVSVNFIRAGSSADQAIKHKISQLKRSAANWTLVSSDLDIQSYARRAKAKISSSEQFAAHLMQILSQADAGQQDNDRQDLSANDLQEWFKLFGVEE
jgi:uncharacterized protein